MIKLKEKVSLCKPSKGLINLVDIVEKTTMKVLCSTPMEINLLNDIMEELEGINDMPLIGCLDHQHLFTLSILKSVLITRMHFICKQANYNNTKQSNNKTRELRKLSKLV
jgi:hypothetical protein